MSVLSERHEGWTVVKIATMMVGSFGGNLEQVSSKRLWADIEAGKTDIIQLYKIYPLTG